MQHNVVVNFCLKAKKLALYSFISSFFLFLSIGLSKNAYSDESYNIEILKQSLINLSQSEATNANNKYDLVNVIPVKVCGVYVASRGNMLTNCGRLNPKVCCAEDEICAQNKYNAKYSKNQTVCAQKVEIKFTNEEKESLLSQYNFNKAYDAYKASDIINAENYKQNCKDFGYYCKNQSVCVNYQKDNNSEVKNVCIPPKKMIFDTNKLKDEARKQISSYTKDNVYEYDEYNVAPVKVCGKFVSNRGNMITNCGRLNPNVCCGEEEICMQNVYNPNFGRRQTVCAQKVNAKFSSDDIQMTLNSLDFDKAYEALDANDDSDNEVIDITKEILGYKNNCDDKSKYCAASSICVTYESDLSVCIPAKKILNINDLNVSNAVNDNNSFFDDNIIVDQTKLKNKINNKIYESVKSSKVNDPNIINWIIEFISSMFNTNNVYRAADYRNVSSSNYIRDYILSNTYLYAQKCGVLDVYCYASDICVEYNHNVYICTSINEDEANGYLSEYDFENEHIEILDDNDPLFDSENEQGQGQGQGGNQGQSTEEISINGILVNTELLSSEAYLQRLRMYTGDQSNESVMFGIKNRIRKYDFQKSYGAFDVRNLANNDPIKDQYRELALKNKLEAGCGLSDVYCNKNDICTKYNNLYVCTPENSSNEVKPVDWSGLEEYKNLH